MKKASKNPGTASRRDNSKPGSDSKHIERPRDFGIDPDNTTEVRYASHAALGQDPGRRQAHSGDGTEGRRDVGVGVDGGGTGAGSGGDIDPDIVGVGTHGSGVSQSLVTSTGTPVAPSQMSTRSKTSPANRLGKGPSDERPGSLSDDESSAQDLQELTITSADDIRTDAGDPFEDATAGEISADEANGTDNDEGDMDDESD